MAKFKDLGCVERDQLERMVPPEYRALARTLAHTGVQYHVVQFAHDRQDVVTSASVRRALAKIATEHAIFAVGANFTAEATKLLEEREAFIARLSDFHWTDESYASIRQ
jgi:hypothetical protein